MLYECQKYQSDLDLMAKEEGRECLGTHDMPVTCIDIVATWSRGSKVYFAHIKY